VCSHVYRGVQFECLSFTGFSESVWVAYVRLERASASVKLLAGGLRLLDVRLQQHHGSLSNQLGSPGKFEATNISFCAEARSVLVEI
jgi:hypothetical protein